MWCTWNDFNVPKCLDEKINKINVRLEEHFIIVGEYFIFLELNFFNEFEVFNNRKQIKAS